MFIERDDIIIRIEHISCITKEDCKIIFLLSCGKTVIYNFKNKSDLETSYQKIRNAISGKTPQQQQQQSSLPKAAVDWLWKDDDDDDDY